jgi:hypothetical protein
VICTAPSPVYLAILKAACTPRLLIDIYTCILGTCGQGLDVCNKFVNDR